MTTIEKHIESILSQLPKNVGDNDIDVLYFPPPTTKISFVGRNPPPEPKLLCFKWDTANQEWYFVV